MDLVDWSGRIVREGKRGAIPEDLPPILDRLEIDVRSWLRTIRRGQRLQFHHAVGRASAIKAAAEKFGRNALKGLGFARAFFPEPGQADPHYPGVALEVPPKAAPSSL